MWYAIISEDNENSLEKRASARPAHLDRLHQLRDDGRLLIAGPHPAIDSEDPGSAGFSGSLVVAEFDSLESAKAGHQRTLTWPQVYTQMLPLNRLRKFYPRLNFLYKLLIILNKRYHNFQLFKPKW